MKQLLINISFISLLVTSPSTISSQTLNWEKSISQQFQQNLRVSAINDTLLYMAGSSTFFVNGIQQDRLSLIKANVNGDTLSITTYRLPGIENYFPHDIFFDGDKVVLVCAGVAENTGGLLSFFLGVNNSGGIVNFVLYNQATLGNSQKAISLPNKEYLLTGSRNFFSGGNIDIFLTRVDSVGNVIKDTSYNKPFPQEAFSIEPLYDGSFLIGGVTGTAQGPAAYVMQVTLEGHIVRDTIIQTPQAPFNNTRVFFNQLADDSWSISGQTGSSNTFLYRVGSSFQAIPGSYSTSLLSNNKYYSYATQDSGFLYIRTTSPTTIGLLKFDKNQSVSWTYSFFTPPAPFRYFNDLCFDGSGSVIGGGIIDGSSQGNSNDYYYSKISNAGLPFIKNLCRNAPAASFSVQDSAGMFYVRNTSFSGLIYNPALEWEWVLPFTGQVVADTLLVLPGAIPPQYPVAIRVRNYYGCTDTLQADIYQVLGTTSFDPLGSEAPSSIYPNPTTDLLHIQPSAQHRGSVRLEILSTDGRLLQQFVHAKEVALPLPVHTLSSGLYLLRISSATHTEVLRWVKE